MKAKLFFFLIFILQLYSLEEPVRIKRKASQISTLSEQEATQELITIIEKFNGVGFPEPETINRINELLELGANPNAKNNKNKPILLLATEKWQKEIITALLQYGANPDIQDNAFNSPLLEATHYNLAEIVSILLAAGANPNIKDNKGNTPLRRALRLDHIKIINLLLQAGADPNITNDNGHSALTMLNFKIARAQQQNKETLLGLLLNIKKWIEHPKTLPKLGIQKIR